MPSPTHFAQDSFRPKAAIRPYLVGLIVVLLSGFGLARAAQVTAPAEVRPTVKFDFTGNAQSPRVDFAVNEIQQTWHKLSLGGLGLTVTFAEDQNLEEQAYHIEVEAPPQFTVSGGDSLGLMYGGLRLAEALKLGHGWERIRAESGSPYLPYRGLKMNIPFDARTPSYDDTGDSALWNIATMWDFSFWQAQLDEMARHRYNALTIWNPHPFPSLVKLPEFPDVALHDVCTTTYRYPHTDHPRKVAPEVLENLVTLKQLSIEDKIDFWRRVMAYAKDRGIEVFIITWNVHLDGAYGKYGITDEPNNATTLAYMRACIRETLLTYPDLAGIGLTAGEMMTQFPTHEAKEKWLWQTYGLGVNDALAVQPDRIVRFIHRDWETGLDPILQEFADYPGPFDVSYKYAKARIHSKPDPQFADELIAELQPHHLKSWWNLRNDDLYCLRWGDPDYVRAMIKNMPLAQTAGFHMGSDGYVWARNFSLRDEAQRGGLEIDRHWYNFMLWGRLGYDPSLDRRLFESMLQDRYPTVDAALLYDTWATSSQIMPQINRFFFKRGDWMFAPEACQSLVSRFLTVDDFITGSSDVLEGAKEIGIRDYLNLSGPIDPGKLTTPFAVADNLDAFARDTLTGCERLRTHVSPSSGELDGLLTDLEAMAWMARYYADKIRGATHVAQYRHSGDTAQKNAAVVVLENAVLSWRKYAQLASSQYRPQVLARGQLLDWNLLTADVEKEVATVRAMTPAANRNQSPPATPTQTSARVAGHAPQNHEN